MRLEPLYVLRFAYPDGWQARVGEEPSTEETHFYFADGRREGGGSGRFRAANHPRRRSDGTFAMAMRGFIETDDGAVIIAEYRGYGRAYPVGRRQVVGAVRHVSEDARYAQAGVGVGRCYSTGNDEICRHCRVGRGGSC